MTQQFTSVDIRPNLEAAPWTDLGAAGGPDLHGTVERVGLLPNGTQGGRPSVALLIRLGDGRTVVAETTWALYNGAARALAASPVAEADRRKQEGRP